MITPIIYICNNLIQLPACFLEHIAAIAAAVRKVRQGGLAQNRPQSPIHAFAHALATAADINRRTARHPVSQLRGFPMQDILNITTGRPLP